MRTKNLKRLLSLLLCLCMVAGLLPATALAVTLPDGTETGTVSATIYLDTNNDGIFEGDGKGPFAADQTGLILDLRNFSDTLPEGSQVGSIIFYPKNPGETEWGTVIWYTDCGNGTLHDKLYDAYGYNGVFQLQNFAPNGNMSLEPGDYQVLVYVETGSGEKCYLSNESFTITDATGSGGSGGPVTPSDPVITTTSLPTAYVGEAYSQPLTATPGTAGNALTWTVAEGSTLPNGLTLSADGVLSGTPTAAGSSTFTVQVSETVESGDPPTATQQLTLTVTERLAITNETTTFNPKRGESFSVQLTANLEGVTWKITDGYLPTGLSLQNGVITGAVADNVSEGDYQVTVQATSTDGQTTTKEFTIQIGSRFQFNLTGTIDSDAMDRYAYLRATKDTEDITLWSGTLTEGTTSLTVNKNFAGATVSNARLITYAGGAEAVLAESSGPLTLTDGQGASLTGKGEDVLVELPEITHSYGANANIWTWFEGSGSTYQPGAIVPAAANFTLRASASSYGKDAPLAEYDLTTATFKIGDTTITTYNPAENPSGGAITVSYPKYTLTTVTVTLTGTDSPDLSYAKLSFSQSLNGWTYAADAVVGAEGNSCTVELYGGVDSKVYMTNAGGYDLVENTIEASGITINGNVQLTVSSAKERDMTVLVKGKLANNDADFDADFAKYAKALDNSVGLQAATDGKSWSIGSANLSTLLNTHSKFYLWDKDYQNELNTLVSNENDQNRKLTLSCEVSGPVLNNSQSIITWKKGSYTGLTTDLTVNLRGGVLFSLTYNSTSRTHMQGWWHQNGTWVRGQYCTVYGGDNTIAQYCPGNAGIWDFLLLPSGINPSGMTWADALTAYHGMPNTGEDGVSIVNNNVAKLENQTLEQRAADSAIYLTLPNSTFTGPRQFDSTNDTLVFTGHIELDEGARNEMSILRLDASADSSIVLSTQISSVVINGKTYPYTGIVNSLNNQQDKLICAWNGSYYEIEFSDPIELPCDITVYAKPASPTSAAVLDMSVTLTGEGSEPVGRVEVSPPSLSVDMPDTVGGKTFTAYVTIPTGNYYVDVYDGVDLVGRADRTGDTTITLSGASDSRVTSHELRFVLRDGTTEKEIDTQTVLHANGAPTLRGQSLQYKDSPYSDWATFQRDSYYAFHTGSQFRMTAAFDHPENLKDGKVVFAVKLLDGTTRYMEGKAEGTEGTFITDTFTPSSPVIGATVVFEIDWAKVNKKISDAALPVPTDSPTATGNYNFDQTIVLDYGDVKSKLPTGTMTQERTLTDKEKADLQELKGAIKKLYEDCHGTAGFYTIIGDGSEFFTGQSMIGSLSSDMLPTGYTGETSFTRPLTEQELGTELGSGSGWTRLTFTEPGSSNWGGTGAGGTTGVEIYTHQMTTDSGVSGTLTITRIGEGEGAGIYETGFATAEGTGGSGTPSLPADGQYNAGGEALASGGGFSFTNLESSSSDLDVFSNFCDDVNAGAGIGGSILELFGEKAAEGAWKAASDSAGVIGAGKSVYEGWKTSESLGDLREYINNLMLSRCAGKLSPNVRANLQSQIDSFNKMADEAMQWNIANTMGGTISGVAGMMTMLSNPLVGLGLGIGALGTSIVNRQQIDNVYKEAQLIRDMVRMQITKYANANNDPDCDPENDSNYRVSIDPSGIVYEAVLSNPVKGATVTLYTAEDGNTYVPQYTDGVYVDQYGKPVAPNNVSAYTGSGNLAAPNVNDLEPGVLTLTTGADGRYQWMVPAGLWYVTAEKGAAGYEAGSSDKDIAAVVSKGGKNWLPVLPAQLDVNIPLVSYAIPTVTAEYRSDGVYLTFSKYMDNTTLTAAGAFKIGDTGVDPANVKLLNSEQAPSNINYGTGNTAPWYTSQVKLEAANLTGEVTVTIGSVVKSYAGVPCTTQTGGLTLSGTVSAATPVAKPTFTPNGGQVAYGSTVTITCETDGATLYYTTDRSTPTTSSTRYYTGQTIAIDRNMTIKVLAVKPGYTDATASASFTVPSDNNIYGGNGGGGNSGTGGTTSGGSSGSTRYTVSAPEAVTGGSLTVSPKSASKGDTVTITVKPDKGYELDKLTVTDSKGNEVKLTEKNGKYTFTMPASGVSIKASFKPAEISNPFTDVAENAYYYDAVLWAAEKGITGGTTATTFSPNAPCTRAQIVTFLWRAAGSPEPKSMNSFADVPADAYYAKAVAWAIENGITGGVGDGKFAPDATCTRSQSAAFLYRAAGSPAVSGDAAFSDVSADAYYAAAVAWAAQNGITGGTTATTFSPANNCTRAQIVTFLYRAYQGE